MADEPSKIKIEVLDTGEIFHVQYNPPEYTVTKGANTVEIGIPGLDSPILQFTRGTAEQISLKLFFDTTGDYSDVRNVSGRFYRLVKINSDLHAPPRCKLSWGKAMGAQVKGKYPLEVKFIGVVTNISQRFTLFKSDGTPMRAEMDVTFKEYKTLDQQIRELKLQSSDHTKSRKVKRGETLSSIAAEVYGDPGSWRELAKANSNVDPRAPGPGTELLIMPLDPDGKIPDTDGKTN